MEILKRFKTINRIYFFLLVMCFSFNLSPAASTQKNYEMVFDSGTFYGPGNMPDAKMPSGLISSILLETSLNGHTPYFNNGIKKPNLSSVSNNEFWKKGTLSNGVSYNELMEGGIVDIGEGALSLFTVVSSDGILEGRQLYETDKYCNWNIVTDLALDPGFKEGIIFARNLTITTGLRWVPLSLQTQQGFPGGTDKAGSLASSTPLIGDLGDSNRDGFLDGKFVGVANIPLDHIFYPGASVVQSRSFKTNIPITQKQVSLLTLSNLLNYTSIFESALSVDTSKGLNAFYANNVEKYLKDIEKKLSDVIEIMEKKSRKRNKLSTVLQKIIELRKSSQNNDAGALSKTEFLYLNRVSKSVLQQLSILSEMSNDLEIKKSSYCRS